MISKLWGYVIALAGFIAGLAGLFLYGKKVGSDKQELEQADKTIEDQAEVIAKNEENRKIRERVARMSTADVDRELRDFYREDSDV